LAVPADVIALVARLWATSSFGGSGAGGQAAAVRPTAVRADTAAADRGRVEPAHLEAGGYDRYRVRQLGTSRHNSNSLGMAIFLSCPSNTLVIAIFLSSNSLVLAIPPLLCNAGRTPHRLVPECYAGGLIGLAFWATQTRFTVEPGSPAWGQSVPWLFNAAWQMSN
jgi:hypothetical protein